MTMCSSVTVGCKPYFSLQKTVHLLSVNSFLLRNKLFQTSKLIAATASWRHGSVVRTSVFG